jgi:cobalt/nickel transport system permease protein
MRSPDSGFIVHPSSFILHPSSFILHRFCMHINALDQFHDGTSPVHRLDPRVKLLVAIGFILACALMPDGAWLGFLALLVVWLVTVLLSDVPSLLLLKRALVALPFALAAVTVLFTIPGAPLATVTVPLVNWQLTITDAGVVRFVTILLKSWLSVLMAMLLVATTTFPDLMRAMRGIGVPKVLVGVISFMYRYIFVLADEVQRLTRAREARSATGPAGHKSGGNVIWRAKIVGGMVGSLFVRSLARSERVYFAMASRGYTGELLWLDKPHLRRTDILAGVAFGLVLVLIVLLARLVKQ